jgi:hypothetical protein
MHTHHKHKILLGAGFLALGLVLSGCVHVKDDGPAAVSSQTGTKVEQAAGSTESKVQEYTDRAKEALSELKALLEEEAAKQSSIDARDLLHRLAGIGVALAQDQETDIAQQVQELLDEITLNSELALEALEGASDVDELSDLLDEVQETQELVVDELEAVAELIGDDTDLADVVSDIAVTIEETEVTIEDVDDAISEVELALEEGETSVVAVEFDTTVDLLREAGEPIITGFNREVIHERRLNKAQERINRAREELISNGVSVEEADAIAQEMRAKLDDARGLGTANFGQARTLAREQLREARKVEHDAKKKLTEEEVHNRLAKAKEHVAAIQAAGGAVDADTIARVESALASGKGFEAQRALRKIEHDSRTAIRSDERKARSSERREEFREVVNAKRDERAGRIDKAEFERRVKDSSEEQRTKLRIETEKRKQAAREGDVRPDRIRTATELRSARTQDEQRKTARERTVDRAREKADEVRLEREVKRVERKDTVQDKKETIRDNVQEKKEETLERVQDKKEDVRETVRDRVQDRRTDR